MNDLKEHAVEVTVLPGDLADPETPDRLFQSLAKQGKLVTHLVNNVGFVVFSLASGFFQIPV